MSDGSPGQLDLSDSYQPGIKDATYELSVKQTVSAPGASVTPVTQRFVVQGPRFAIDPADVHAQLPPNGATGQFAEVLPQVVLNKRVLPWERDLPPFAPSVPWLALLVFADGELAGDRGSGDYAQTTTVGALVGSSAGVRKPALTDVSAKDKATACRTITFAGSLFAQIVPTGAELPLLAHVRELDATGQPSLDVKDAGTFSVVLANRFPLPGDATHGATNVAHLVSLEGFGDLLGGSQPQAPAQAQVEMLTLASWTFSCLADPSQTFTGLATNLSRDATGAERSAGSLLLRLPVEPPPSGASDLAAQAQRRLAEGHLALGYHAQTGEDAFAWYRGPLAPVVPAALPAGVRPFASASAAMQFDPQTGLFDHGLAAAWQLGRSLALADEAFATALMRVRQRANAGVDAQLASGDAAHARLAAALGGGLLEAVGRASREGDATPPPPTPVAPHQAPAPAPVAAVRGALAQAAAGGSLADPADPDVAIVVAWLAQAILLAPVPFDHLVADARMLPAESIRFFYVDPAWVGALVDGALGIGVGTSRELQVQQALTTQLEQLASAAALAYRAAQQHQPAPKAATGPSAGLLLRSALASGWPGLVVSATTGAGGTGDDVALLRLEHLAPTVLLCLFNGVPGSVTLAEPYEGLQAGVDDQGQIVLRQLTAPIGKEKSTVKIYDPDAPATSMPTLRAGGRRVLNVDAGGSDLLAAVASGLGVDRATIGPADLALQLLRVPEQVTFSAPSA